jgi:3-phosphoshikimate 1-carboxyvinyltransferase
VLDSDDTRYMLNALRKLGVEWTQDGAGLRDGAQAFFQKQAELFLGNAGRFSPTDRGARAVRRRTG